MIDTGFLAIAAGWGVALIALSYALSERRERKWAQDSSDRQASALEARRAKDPVHGPDGRFVKKGAE